MTDQAIPPQLECDVVMKGGITSGVIYPTALERLSRTYRFRGLGGASAGAIGAALAAAAEHGRTTGGFSKLPLLATSLGDGRLRRLFQPTEQTHPMLRLMLAATTQRGWRRIAAIAAALIRSFLIWLVLGALPGAAIVVFGCYQTTAARVVLIIIGALVVVTGAVLAATLATVRVLTRDVTSNNFGICTGLRTKGSDEPGFTDWLSDQLDDLAGQPGPLTFGQLWTGTDTSRAVDSVDRQVDLRLITTCLSEARPFELPSDRGRYFYDEDEWRNLFPKGVVDHLVAKERPDTSKEQSLLASNPTTKLRRMPLGHDLPVIVATRMSLSFPLLISAVPMWTLDRRRNNAFVKVWFTDGGLCNNFPLQLFDTPLPTRPTFAINLGRFGEDTDEDSCEDRKNLRWAKDNNSGIAPRVQVIPRSGFKAIIGFASVAFDAARNWTDASQLDQPGSRDRIVEVLQTARQGGMNLDMATDTIEALAQRGATAGDVLVEQFTTPKYNNNATGWDNHRWIRYRATLNALPEWLAGFKAGHSALAIDLANQPSHELTDDARPVAELITNRLLDLANEVENAGESSVTSLRSTPRPAGVIRRVPTL